MVCKEIYQERNPCAIEARGASSAIHLFNEKRFDSGLLIVQQHGFP